jgi:gamma-D-glutamyl-L-lysine dipeptidyl-peptidase
MPSVICPLAIVPVRMEPAHRSEMVTQWLFGETAEVLEQGAEWSRLSFDHDGYEGWVQNLQIAECSTPNLEPDLRVIDQTSLVDLGERQVLLPYGAVLPFYQNASILWHGQRVPVSAVTNQNTRGDRADLIETYIHPFLGAPYLWGGRTPSGVDCSGFTQAVFMLMGIYLQRDAHQQAEEGEPVEFVDLAITGDLAFFDNEEGRITHVGIVLRRDKDGPAEIVHACGRVRIDTLDQQGIFDTEAQRYTHRLRLVKRVA